METTVENSTPQQGKKAPHRGVYVLPNLITSLSMFMGFLCMVWAVQGRFEAAVYAVFLSALLDGMDGKVARLTHTASEFGVQYDSLADLVAFGVAPAMLMWQWQLEAFGRWGVAVAFIYAACGALRLARFNVSTSFVSKRFFIGQVTEAAILGSLAAVGMMILRLPYATAIGALIGVTALIPIAGAWIGAIVGAIMIFPISPVKAIVFLVFILILQQTENNVIYPRVVGSSIGLPGIWVLAAITVGGGLGGVAGMLVAVPTVALIVALIDEDAEKRLNKRESSFTDTIA